MTLVVLFPDSFTRRKGAWEAIVGGTYPTMHNRILEQWCGKEAEIKALTDIAGLQ